MMRVQYLILFEALILLAAFGGVIFLGISKNKISNSENKKKELISFLQIIILVVGTILFVVNLVADVLYNGMLLPVLLIADSICIALGAATIIGFRAMQRSKNVPEILAVNENDVEVNNEIKEKDIAETIKKEDEEPARKEDSNKVENQAKTEEEIKQEKIAKAKAIQAKKIAQAKKVAEMKKNQEEKVEVVENTDK